MISTAAKKKIVPKKTCQSCHPNDNLKSITDFYVSKNPIHHDGRVPWCKQCIAEYSLLKTGEIDEEKFKNVLRQIDKPYYKDLLNVAMNQFKKEHSYIQEEDVRYHGKEIIGIYFTKQNSLRQYQSKSYGDSEKEGFVRKKGVQAANIKVGTQISQSISEKVSNKYELGDFTVTDEIKSLFGYGYDDIVYKKMYDKYEKLKYNYPLQTSLHQEALATYVRFKVKEEEATALGCVDEAKKWYDAAQIAAEKGKLTPKQLTKEDLQSGVNSMCELTKTLEQAVDVIKILPQFKYRPNDSVDFTIMCYINYERELSGQPQVDYSDIYSFYDRKKKEYIEQNGDPFGIFKDDPTEKNRANVQTFIKLPDDYDDLAGDCT